MQAIPENNDDAIDCTLHTTILSNKGYLSGLSWSPNGNLIATCSAGTVTIWDARSGKLRQQLFRAKFVGITVSWSPDGRLLATSSYDKTIQLWHTDTWKHHRAIKSTLTSVSRMAWSPDSRYLAAVSNTGDAIVWNSTTWDIQTSLLLVEDATFASTSLPQDTSVSFKKAMQLFITEGREPLQSEEELLLSCVTWSPDGRMLVVSSQHNTVQVWNTETWSPSRTFKGPSAFVSSMVWSPDSRYLVASALDNNIYVWSALGDGQDRVIEGHTSPIYGLSLSYDGDLLASQAEDAVCIWRFESGEPIAILDGQFSSRTSAPLAFSPRSITLALMNEQHSRILLWKLKFDPFKGGKRNQNAVRYTNAKVVLVGETSAGKTCLARALMGELFVPQESSHGMKIWTFQTANATDEDGRDIIRETLLWDLAGQTDYQVVHQLFLDETALGVVLFDGTHPENPFGGVGHWAKALEKVAGDNCPRILVAGRVDRGSPTATDQDIEEYRQHLGFASFCSTSAKTNVGIAQLKSDISAAIPWERLPVTVSPKLWRDMREFILSRRAEPNVLARRKDLREAFQREHESSDSTMPGREQSVLFVGTPLRQTWRLPFVDKILLQKHAEFDTVITHAQAQGLVWRLSFGDFVLLRPELMNDYASAIVRAARKHPQGLGCVDERAILEASIDFEDLPRIADRATESTLLHAVVELFLTREVALREGERLVFPSKFNRKRPGYPHPPLREVVYKFAGPVEDIYATLIVRLIYSGAFDLKDLFQNAAEFLSPAASLCGFVLAGGEGEGQVSIFFGEDTATEIKVVFVRFIHEHLTKRAIQRSLVRERIYRCGKCSEEVDNRRAIEFRLKQGMNTIPCQFCNNEVRLIDLLEERFGDPQLLMAVRALEKRVEEKKDQEVGVATAKAKDDIREFDVFMAHNSLDKPTVMVVVEELRARGLSPWIDAEQIAPGRWYQDVIQQALGNIKSAAIFIGPHGVGKWQIAELRTFISQCVESGLPVIPVLLPGIDQMPEHLLFLKELHWVRFGKSVNESGPLDSLEWGITGKKPNRMGL